MVRRCEFCDSPVPADATICPVCREGIAEETLERILPLLKRPASKEVRFMGTGERMWGVLRRPSAAYRDIGQRPDAAGPFVMILINAAIIAGLFLSLSSKVTAVVIVNSTTMETVNTNVLASPHGAYFYLLAFVGMLPSIMLGMIYLIVGTAFAHFVFKLTGGSGSRMKTLSVIGYSITPIILVRLLSIVVVLAMVPGYPTIVNFYNPDALATITPAIVNFAYASNVWYIIDVLTTGSFVWTGFLLIFGIREAHDTSTLWAVVIAIICTIVLGWTFWQAH
ncbi:YIP1 family protein [Candidatus Thorarchaeota archaeon]|nr:YIP1 family protein [Candidatus Thorarchaeota archaeon]TFG98007.1 MAG: YIP1 family protein [Candidatus Thorarchaeota archaeon]